MLAIITLAASYGCGPPLDYNNRVSPGGEEGSCCSRLARQVPCGLRRSRPQSHRTCFLPYIHSPVAATGPRYSMEVKQCLNCYTSQPLRKGGSEMLLGKLLRQDPAPARESLRRAKPGQKSTKTRSPGPQQEESPAPTHRKKTPASARG